MQLVDIISTHWHYFWFIAIPTAVSTAFFIGTLFYKMHLGLRRKKDEESARKAVSDLVVGLCGEEAKEIVLTRNLFGGDSKNDGVLVEFGNRKYKFLEPESSAMHAVRHYFKKHERANAVAIIAFYIFATCFVAYAISWLAFFIIFPKLF